LTGETEPLEQRRENELFDEEISPNCQWGGVALLFIKNKLTFGGRGGRSKNQTRKETDIDEGVVRMGS